MGRVDEALRRSHTDVGRGVGTPPAAGDGSPWTFDEEPERALEPADSPVDRPSSDSPVHRSPGEPPAGPLLLDGEGQLALFRGFDAAALDRLVVSKAGSSMLAEQFRTLAATLHHAQLAQDIKTVMVTSPSVGDGKSLTATNLALTLSRSYHRRVLLIDADLRRPSLHHVFQVPNVSGLNEGLKAKADEKLPLLQITEQLALLPAGRPEADPLSGLASVRLRRIIEEAAERFDWVILDTPPAGVLADATLVSNMVDAAVLVIRARVTPFPQVEAAVAAIGRERIFGVVLNAVDPATVHAGNDYNRYYGGGAGNGG